METRHPQWGLVLSGGGFSASYGVGVMQALIEDYRMPKPAVVVGSSGSAPTACLFSTGQVEETMGVWTNEMTDPTLLSTEKDGSTPRLDVERVVSTVRKHLDFNCFAKDDSQVYFTATDLALREPSMLDTRKTAENDPVDEDLFYEMMRASMAYGREVRINGKRYVDGDISSSNAHKVDFIRSLGIEHVMVVNSARVEMGKELLKIVRAIHEREVLAILRANYRSLLKGPDCILVSPSRKLPSGLFKSNQREDIEGNIELGRSDALKHRKLAEFAEFIGKNNLPRVRACDSM